jgi:hypothetical protein
MLLWNDVRSTNTEPVTLSLQRQRTLTVNPNARFAFRSWGNAFIANLHRNLYPLPQSRLESCPPN